MGSVLGAEAQSTSVGLGGSCSGKLSGSLGNYRELHIAQCGGSKGECERVADNKAENMDRNGVTKGLRF